MTPCYYILKRTFTKAQQFGGCYLANRITTKLHLHFPLPHYNDTMLYSKMNFYKSQPPQLPQQMGGGCYLANRITTKLHLHFPLPHYNDTMLYSKTNFYKSQPQLPQQFEGGCYLANRITTKLHLHFPLPHYSDTVLYSKTNFYKSQPPQLPQQFGGGCYLANRITTKLHLHFPLPHYNDTVLYSKTNFYKSQPPQLPQQFGGGAFSQTGLPQNSISTSPSLITMTPCHYILKRTFTKAQQFGGCYLANRITTKLHLHFPLPHYNDTMLYSKMNFYKSQPPQLPQQMGGVLSRKPDYHKTPSPLPLPPLQWHHAIF